MSMNTAPFSVIIPARNEAPRLVPLVTALIAEYPNADIIVVDDGSTDETATALEGLPITVHRHPYAHGPGAALKRGLCLAQHDTVVLMDGDGQHQVSSIAPVLAKFHRGYDMVVGARNKAGQASIARYVGNRFYNWLASLVVGHPVLDLTSGFRILKRRLALQLIHLLPNGFSSQATLTLSFFKCGYSVGYVPIEVLQRTGKSHIRLFRDGLRFFIIIFKIAFLYSPIKCVLPLALFIGLITFSASLLGMKHHADWLVPAGLFSVMLAVIIGLVAEQLTMLLYQPISSKKPVDHESVATPPTQ